MYCVVEVQTHAFLSSAVEVGEWSAACLGRSIPREDYPDSFSEGEFMRVKAGLEVPQEAKISCFCLELSQYSPVIQPVV